MQSENGNVRYVVWSELFGWFFLLVRALRLSLQLRKLLLATMAVFLTMAGWGAIGYVVSGSENDSVAATGQEDGESPWTLGENQPRTLGDSLSDTITEHFTSPLEKGWATMTKPFRLVFTGRPNLVGAAISLLLGFWAIFIWGLFGGMIGRIAAVELAAGEPYSLGRAFRFTRQKWPSYFAAPLMPMSVVLIGTLMMALLGFVMRADVGMLLAAILWPIVLVGCAFLVLVMIGLAFGWPLMWGTISSEGTDAFDAVSRAYAYTTQRPLNYLFYAVVASLLGGLGLVFVEAFATGVINLSRWGVAWGGGTNSDTTLIEQLAREVANGDPSYVQTAAGFLFAIWFSVVEMVAVGFIYSYFWTAGTAIYLLLRRDVDAGELDEVYLEDEPTGEGLAPLVNDEAGVPGVAEDEDTGEVDEE